MTAASFLAFSLCVVFFYIRFIEKEKTVELPSFLLSLYFFLQLLLELLK